MLFHKFPFVPELINRPSKALLRFRYRKRFVTNTKASNPSFTVLKMNSMTIIALFPSTQPQPKAFSRSKSSLNDKHQQPLSISSKFPN